MVPGRTEYMAGRTLSVQVSCRVKHRAGGMVIVQVSRRIEYRAGRMLIVHTQLHPCIVLDTAIHHHTHSLRHAINTCKLLSSLPTYRTGVLDGSKMFPVTCKPSLEPKNMPLSPIILLSVI